MIARIICFQSLGERKFLINFICPSSPKLFYFPQRQYPQTKVLL
ncbi:MAG: hypothetical protein CH104c_0376 [Candidatus Woesebacteria bacterium]|nr:MAG: hypothetical protein CH104c_0376 [Candidatus Woesebacteria bacterium]